MVGRSFRWKHGLPTPRVERCWDVEDGRASVLGTHHDWESQPYRRHAFRRSIELPEHRAIWGTDAQAKSISVLDPYPTNYTFQFNNHSKVLKDGGFSCYVAADGCWVTPDDVIERLYVPFDGLDDWVLDPTSSGSDYFPTDEAFRKFEIPERLTHGAQLGKAQVRLVADSEGSASGQGFLG